MRIIGLLGMALSGVLVFAVTGCGGSSNPGPAANIQACQDYAAYAKAVSSGAVLQSEETNGNAGPAGDRLAAFLVGRSGKINTEVSQPLRHDLAKVLVDASLGTNSQGYLTDDIHVTIDCAAVKATHGAKA